MRAGVLVPWHLNVRGFRWSDICACLGQVVQAEFRPPAPVLLKKKAAGVEWVVSNADLATYNSFFKGVDRDNDGCVCLCGYVCVHQCVCMYVCLYVCERMRVCLCVDVGVCAYVYVYVQVYV